MGLRLLTVHAHPDDETIGCGGVLSLLADRGVETSLVCCTDGKLATIFATDMPEETTRPHLADIRKDELRAAAAILGIGEVTFLDYGDSGMAGADTNTLPEAFWNARIDEVVERLVSHIRRIRPHVVITYDGNGGYGHPDHIQTHRGTLLAVEAAATPLYPQAGEPWQVSKFYYTALPISAAHRVTELARAAGVAAPFGGVDLEALGFAVPDELITTVVDCREAVARKRAALRAHHSQMPADFPLLVIPEDVMVAELGNEHFRLIMSRVTTAFPETDVFAGISGDGQSA